MLHHIFGSFVIFYFQGHADLEVTSNHSLSPLFHFLHHKCPIYICINKLITIKNNNHRYSYNKISFSNKLWLGENLVVIREDQVRSKQAEPHKEKVSN